MAMTSAEIMLIKWGLTSIAKWLRARRKRKEAAKKYSKADYKEILDDLQAKRKKAEKES